MSDFIIIRSYLVICLSVYLSICLSSCLSVCLFIFSVCFFVLHGICWFKMLTLLTLLTPSMFFSDNNFEKKLFSQIFMKSSSEPNFDMENSRINLIFQYFFVSIFIFTLISQKCLKKCVKLFFSDFHENCHITYF